MISIDGTLIDAVLSMYWADYRKDSKKAKGHFGFNINTGIPSKVYLIEGNGGERAFVSRILSNGQTGVMDRCYQCHKDFDSLQKDGKIFFAELRSQRQKLLLKSTLYLMKAMSFMMHSYISVQKE